MKLSIRPKNVVRLRAKTVLRHFTIASSLGLVIALCIYLSSIFSKLEVSHANTMFDEGYYYRQLLWTDKHQVKGKMDLYDIMVIYETTDPNLSTLTNGGMVFNNDGSDIVFTKLDGSTKLDYTIIEYNPVTGKFAACIFLDTLYHNMDTKFYMYYGNPTPGINNDQFSSSTLNAFYNFNNGFNDISSNENDGISVLGAGIVNGYSSNALESTGGGGHVSIPTDSSLSFGSEGTIMLWINVNSFLFNAGLIHKGDSINDSDMEYSLEFRDRTLMFILKNHNQIKFIRSRTELNAGQWYHIVVTFKSHRTELYIDGVRDVKLEQSLIPQSSGGNLHIGAQTELFENPTTKNFPFDGRIDEVIIFNKWLKKNSVETLFNSQIDPQTFVLGGSHEINPGGALPIELLSFNAKFNGSSVDIGWSTATETNSDYFYVERSTDFINWKVIGSKRAAGNSNRPLNYFLNDPDPIIGNISYYRLKQVDFDGETNYFNAVTVNTNENYNKFKFLSSGPNPFDNQLNVYFNIMMQGTVIVKITDLHGQIAYSRYLLADKGPNKFVFNDLGNLKSGIYIITLINTDGTCLSEKIIKK